jgi:hypothetical protein
MEGQGVIEMDHTKYYNGGKGNLVWSMKNSKSAKMMRHLRDKNGEWVVRDDVSISFKDKRETRTGKLSIGYTGYGGKSHIGPELQFGHVVGDLYDQPVLLIKTAWGGKSLNKDFRPPSAGGTVGPYYEMMVAEVRAALAHHQKLTGQQIELAGFVWMQGWNDMFDESARNSYADNRFCTSRRHVTKCRARPSLVRQCRKLLLGWQRPRSCHSETRRSKTVAPVRRTGFQPV